MMTRIGRCFAVWGLLAAGLATAPAAEAGDTLPERSFGDPDDDLWNMLQNMPPRRSYDLGIGVSYGGLTYWRSSIGPWIGFNARFDYGAHLGEKRAHRVGAGLALSIEGPAPEFFSTAITPHFAWDAVVDHVAIGASVGPALMIHGRQTYTNDMVTHIGVAPEVSARFGWSQAWSRITRRMYVVVEPRLRWVADAPNAGVSLVVGSGSGR